MRNFETFKVKKRLIEVINKMGFSEPTEVQSLAIPQILEGKDIFVRAKTGTGKTLSFLLPIIEKIEKEELGALIVLPTRELALQVVGVSTEIGKTIGIKSTVVYGGVSISAQIKEIKHNTNIIVGTPGRILDLMRRNSLNLQKIRFLVLDEVDTMLDMGFIEDVETIIKATPKQRQMIMLSATIPQKIKTIANKYSKNIVAIEVGPPESLIVDSIQNTYTITNHSSKLPTLFAYIDQFKPSKAIIFTRTQRYANLLHRAVNEQFKNAMILHGGMTQAKRENSINKFKEMDNGFLISTNVAARGLDIDNISTIINFDAPEDPVYYVHRVGRSARMGKNGIAFTIFETSQQDMVKDIEKYSGATLSFVKINDEKFKDVSLSSKTYQDTYRKDEHYRRKGNFRGHYNNKDDRSYRKGRLHNNHKPKNFNKNTEH